MTDQLCVNTIRITAAEMVQKANSGHPGAPMGLAPVAHVLFNKVMKFNPKKPKILEPRSFCFIQWPLLCIIIHNVALIWF